LADYQLLGGNTDVGSILIYHEPINLKKIGILGLIVVAIVLVWLDRWRTCAGRNRRRKDPPSFTTARVYRNPKSEGDICGFC